MAKLQRHTTASAERPLWTLTMKALEHQYLAKLSQRLHDLLKHPEKSKRVIDRLFPPTFKNRPAEEAQHRQLLGSMLWDQRKDTLQAFDRLMQSTAKAGPRNVALLLTAADIDILLRVTNDLRLMTATELDIQDNGWSERPPERVEDFQAYVSLCFVSVLQEVLLQEEA